MFLFSSVSEQRRGLSGSGRVKRKMNLLNCSANITSVRLLYIYNVAVKQCTRFSYKTYQCPDYSLFHRYYRRVWALCFSFDIKTPVRVFGFSLSAVTWWQHCVILRQFWKRKMKPSFDSSVLKAPPLDHGMFFNNKQSPVTYTVHEQLWRIKIIHCETPGFIFLLWNSFLTVLT